MVIAISLEGDTTCVRFFLRRLPWLQWAAYLQLLLIFLSQVRLNTITPQLLVQVAQLPKTDMSTNVDADLTMSSTLDNGMTLSGLVSLNTNAVNDSGWSLSGDFGKVAFGGTANDGFGATNTGLTADEGNNLSTEYWATHNDAIPHSDISITLPAISGFTIGLGLTDGATTAADSSQWGVTYAMDAGSMGVTVAYASASDGSNADQSSAGVTVTAGDAKVVVATNKKTASSITHTATSVGASYAVSDTLSVQAYTGTTEGDTYC